ncbi:hypothetical protein SLEP1_g40041 [Rubroshorea leprosula]|uniref:Reverse transcriptase domain-containing protein n=1 Tax=Rubroshorea leprosula TaxID=152421 RepID=A0AAV5L279_9ROSI|nr:hypothetical protein SLEP1_g40041 [Rubroshorea leprosula]
MNTIATSISLKVDGQLFELQVMEEEWRVDPDWWLFDDDQQSEIGTKLGFLFEQDCYGEDGIKDGKIGGGYGDSIDDTQSITDDELTENSVEGVANLNFEILNQVKGDGDDGPVSAIGLGDSRRDGLEMGFKEPNQKGVKDKENVLNEELAMEFPSVKGQGKRKHSGSQQRQSSEQRGGQRNRVIQREMNLQEGFRRKVEKKGSWEIVEEGAVAKGIGWCYRRQKKVKLWKELSRMIVEEGGRWMIARDFNAVRCVEERKGLVDVSLTNQRFTWYRPDGTSMSRIDRVLMTIEMSNMGSNWVQQRIQRSISDHCAIIMTSRSVDWGPKLFCVLDVWQQRLEFKDLVNKSWNELKVEGDAGYRCKQKLKSLKGILKRWNIEVFCDVEEQFQRFGFGVKWRGWIMECLSTATVSVLVNGSPTKEFQVRKGLRQGDPLSPFLFLMVGERLHGIVKQAEIEGLLIGANPGTRRIWEPVVNRVWSELAAWKNAILSFRGRLTLLNSVARPRIRETKGSAELKG